ncbi:MAG: recombinase family protein [Planctomycetes bacterium]|nr:recombinase family protein [Planctomycetota bacterium]
MNVVIWARVSSREQAEGYSLDAQIRINREKAEREGWTIVREFVVAESARRGVERAAFNEMYRLVKRQAKRQNIKAILAHKLDRICRNMRDAVRIQELEDVAGVKMVFVDNEFGPGAAGAFSFNVMAAVSQYYSDNLRQEVRKGQDEKIRQGWMPCGVPYGYTNTGDPNEPIRPDPDKAKLVIRLFQLYSQGGMTFRMIANQLHRDGYVYRPSQPRMSPGTISYMLANRFYIGEISWRGQTYPGKHQPLVDLHTFDLCRDILKGKGRRTRRLIHTYADGLFLCEHCGRMMTGERIKRKHTDGSVKVHRYYRCADNQPPADHPRVRWREADVERAVLTELESLRIPTPELSDWLRDCLRHALGQLGDDQAQQKRVLGRRRIELEKQRERLLKLYLDDQLDTVAYQEIAAGLQRQMKEIETGIAALDGIGSGYPGIVDRVFDFTQAPTEGWRQISMGGKQRILRAISSRRTLSCDSLHIEMRKPFSLLADWCRSDVRRLRRRSMRVREQPEEGNGP